MTGLFFVIAIVCLSICLMAPTCSSDTKSKVHMSMHLYACVFHSITIICRTYCKRSPKLESCLHRRTCTLSSSCHRLRLRRMECWFGCLYMSGPPPKLLIQNTIHIKHILKLRLFVVHNCTVRCS